ncbi:hypothetical protein EJD97_017422, partial [Solanum chilense]
MVPKDPSESSYSRVAFCGSIGVELVLTCPSRRCNPSATDSPPSALVSPDEKNVA